MNELDNQIVLCDDQGNEVLAEILFTLDNEDEHFVFLIMPEKDEVLDAQMVEVYRYEELEDGSIGKLIEIDEDDEETWNLIQEVYLAFEESNLDME